MSSSQISTKFKAKREEVSAEVLQSIEKMSSFRNLKEVQVSMLSLRQRLLEDSHTLLEHLSVIRKKYRTEKSSQMENISENLQHRYQYNEKTVIIEGKTAVTKEMMDLIENQISFFNESIKTVDNVLFGIKTRVEIEKTLGI
jgi:transcriptional regulator with AAA-type ATPase domain